MAIHRFRGERVIGWSDLYAIGVIFAALLLAIWGMVGARHPTLAPASNVGLLDIEELQNWHGADIESQRFQRDLL